MVVLEEGSMLTSGPNQYLQPDYLSPLPTTLDAKKSPLALLAQACSQIGADSTSKPLLSSMEKNSKSNSSAANARSPPATKLERNRSSPSDAKNLAFKPYETTVLSNKRSKDEENNRPASKNSVNSACGGHDSSSSVSAEFNGDVKKSSGSHTPVGRKSASPASASGHSSSSPSVNGQERKTPSMSNPEAKSRDSPKNAGASPIVRSGMEILGAHAKDAAGLAAYKAGFGVSSLCCPPGFLDSAAFRSPFSGSASAFSQQHAAATAALLGYPGAPSPNPYLSYARVKTPSGGETLVPVCKDPYCTGCQYSLHNAQLMMGAGSCPSGCTQCDHQKYGLMALSSLGPMPPPPTSLGYPSTLTTAAAAGSRPHVCNWIAGDSYCGKRFSNSEELLQHLRTHASLAAGDPAAAAAASAALMGTHPHPLLSPTSPLHRAAAAGAYPSPSLSPLTSRYHPYSKPQTGPLPTSLAASPYSAFNALGPYYSPYAIYGQRLGAAAVHH